MDVFDVRPKVDWMTLLERIYNDLGLVVAITDKENNVVLSCGDRNEFCAKIRDIGESLSSICAQTQQVMAQEAKAGNQPVVEVCEAGLIKFVIPLFAGDEWVGSLTGCGCSAPGEAINRYIVEKTTQLPDDEIDTLIKTIRPVDYSTVVDSCAALFRELSPDK